MSMFETAQLLGLFKSYFGFESFRGEQESVIQSVLTGQNALVVMPTGFGKSVCYQFPAALEQEKHKRGEPSGLVLVISPLIALMEDQVIHSNQMGLRAKAIHSGMDKKERDRVLRSLREWSLSNEPLSLLYVTPERFQKDDFRQALSSIPVVLMAVDEAHCISLWGHDFRPDYSSLGKIRKDLGDPVTLALTATATPTVQEDILKNLNMVEGHRFLGGIEREELALHVHDIYSLENKIERLVELRTRIQGPILVYWSLISTLEKGLAELRRQGFVAQKYHGQMSPQDRRRVQNEFLESNEGTLFATPAFGLGINKPNIRAVIHGEMPTSIESYYQEVGRAGRDRKPAEGHLLFDEDDVSIAMDFIKWSCPEPEFVRKVYRLIRNRNDEYRSGGNEFLRREMNFYHSRDFRVETSLNQLERAGLLQFDGRYYSDPEKNERWDESAFGEKNHTSHLRAQNEKLLAILQWAKQEGGCRMQTIYSYFGHQNSKSCGHCDLCLSLNNQERRLS